eukprot:TRINITY_DN2596_c1_g1_i1.p1 TRINITY_DN2596_c1_g1~~TRINITY_DN2596_c1_g1_i1.p1  ORF type:complete len:467 (+),score=21.62 TRINITY_DN2596_c1_g1_i1:93-1493(+)
MSVANEETRLLSVRVANYGSDEKRAKRKSRRSGATFPVDVLHCVAPYLETHDWMTAMNVCVQWRVRFHTMTIRYSGIDAFTAHELMFKLLTERVIARRTACEKYPPHEPFIICLYCTVFAVPGILLIMGIQLQFDLPEELSYSFVGTSLFLLTPAWCSLVLGLGAYAYSSVEREIRRRKQSICLHHGEVYSLLSIIWCGLVSNEIRGFASIPSAVTLTGSILTVLGCWGSILNHLDGRHTPSYLWFVFLLCIMALSYPLVRSMYSVPTLQISSALLVLFPVTSFIAAFMVHFMSIGVYSMFGTMTAVCSVIVGCILCIGVPNLSPTESCLNAWSASFLAVLYADVIVACDESGSIAILPVFALVTITALWVANLVAQAKTAWRPPLDESFKVLLFTLPSLILATALSLVALDISGQSIAFTMLFISLELIPVSCWSLVLLETYIDKQVAPRTLFLPVFNPWGSIYR